MVAQHSSPDQPGTKYIQFVTKVKLVLISLVIMPRSDAAKPPSRVAKYVHYEAQLLADMNVTRARKIAASYKVQYYAKMQAQDLIPAIRERMLLVRQCSVCSNAQCNPDTHLFPATTPPTPGEGGSGSESDSGSAHDPNLDGSPDGAALKQLNKASNVADAEVIVTEQLPSFLDSLASQGGASGLQSSSQTTPIAPADPISFDQFDANLSPSQNGDVNAGDGDGSDSEEEDDEAFQARIEAEKEKIRVEINTKRNTLKTQAAEQDRARVLAEQQRKEQKRQRKARRQQQLDELAQQRREALQELEQEAARQQPGFVFDEVFAETDQPRRQQQRPPSPHSSRANRSNTQPRRSVSIIEPARSQSARPPLQSTGMDMSSILDLMDRQHSNTLKVVETALKGISGASGQRVPISQIQDFGHQSCQSVGIDQSGRSQVIHPGNPDAAREMNLGLTGRLD